MTNLRQCEYRLVLPKVLSPSFCSDDFFALERLRKLIGCRVFEDKRVVELQSAAHLLDVRLLHRR